MDFCETEEQLLLRREVRKIVSQFGHRYYLAESENGGKAKELWSALGEAGFLGINIPEEYGGAGLGIYELSLVAEETASLGCPLLLLLVSPAICGSILARHGTEQQKSQFLPGLASARQKMAFAITEPNAGSNSHELSTAAEPDGDDYVISGTKYYISGFDEAEHMLVVCRTGKDEASGRAKLSLFVVDTNAPGIRADPIRVEITSPEKQFTIFFDQVRVPRDRLVGPEHGGFKPLFSGLQPERLLAASVSVGIGRYALEKAADYACERTVWDRPIGAHQGLAHPLAIAKIELELARLMMQKAAWLYDNGHDAAEAANIAKFAAAEAGLQALDAAIQTHGGNGLASEFGLATLWGMARLLRTAPVSREMILNYVAVHSLGLPKSY